MIKKITSIILAFSLLLMTVPCVMASSDAVTLLELSDFFVIPGTNERNYSGYFAVRSCGHFFGSNGIGGKQSGDSFFYLKENSAGQAWISLNQTGDATNVQGINVSSLNKPVVFSFEVLKWSLVSNVKTNVLDYIEITDTTGVNLLGDKIYSNELSDTVFDKITVVYIPQSGGGILTEAYINGKLHSTKLNESGVNDIRVNIEPKSGQEGNYVPFDNFKVVTLNDYVGPILTNAEYINGSNEIINFYEMTAEELKEALATTGVEFSVVDSSGNAVADTANVFTGMKLVSKTTLLGAEYTTEYPLAAGQSHVEKAIAQTNIPAEATADIVLPTQIGDASISWTSSIPDIISNTGTVVRPPASDVVVTLTAEYTDIFKTETVSYDVVVMSQGLATSVSEVNVMLSARKAEPGRTIGYNVRQIDDYGSWNLRYTVSSEDEEIVIDTNNKTISSATAGVYKVKFSGIDRAFEQTEIVAFGTDGRHHIYEATEVYSEDFEGVEYDPNPVLPNAAIVNYNGSKVLRANSKNMNQSNAFGPVNANGTLIPLSDYSFEADIYVDKAEGTSTQNFTVRMRDTNTDAVARTGYNFSFMEYAYLSETTPGIVGTSATDDYVKTPSVFGFSKGHGGTVHTWHFGDTKQVLDVYNADNRGFKKSYHIKCTIIEDTMSATIFDGSDILSTQVVNLADLDNGSSRIEEGYTRFLTEYTGGYIDNIVISTPDRWINSIKIDLGDTTLLPGENTTTYKVLGKSSNDEWIELEESEYTLVLSDEAALSVSDGTITVNSEGTYSVGAYIGDLCYVTGISCDSMSAQKDAVSDLLVINNADSIREDFALPQVPGSTLVWEVSDNTYITIDGNTARVTRPAPGSADRNVTLTATAYCEGFVVQKSIPIVILAGIDEAAILDAAIAQVSIPSSATSNLTLPTMVGSEGVTVTWSSNSSAISSTGAVTRATYDQNVTLTALYKKGSAEKTVNYVVNVPGTEAGGGGGGGGTGSSSGGNLNPQIPSEIFPPSDTTIPSTPPSATKKGFKDVKPDAWYCDSVSKLYELGIINGVSEDEFQPERTITREEFIKLVCTAANIPNSTTDIFTDVPADSWYAQYVGGAVKAEIISGISVDMFGTGLEILRQDMCVMIHKALAYNGKLLDAENCEEFADSAAIKEYAKESVYALRLAEIVNGKDDNMFEPSGKTTRAEAAAIILRMIEFIQS